jgi:hypothetical protein
MFIAPPVGLRHNVLLNIRQPQNAARVQAKEIGNTDKDGQAMTLVCQDYLAGAVRPTEGSKQIAYIKKMEQNLGGLKLIAVDADSKKIVFGKKTFQNLSED